MLGIFNTYKNLFLGACMFTLVLGLYFYIHSLKRQISELQSNLKDSYTEVANYKLQSNRYRTALDSQNAHIEALEASKELAEAKLRKWKNQKPEVKYRTITKIREVHSDDCKAIKNIINDIRKLDYNEL